MKKICIFLSIIAAQFVAAQGTNRTMYIYDNKGYIYPYSVAAIDSIMFDEQEPCLNLAPKQLVIRKGEQALVEAQAIGLGWHIPLLPNESATDIIQWGMSNKDIAQTYKAAPSSFAASACLVDGLRVGTTTLTATRGNLSASIEIEVLPMAASEDINDETIEDWTQMVYGNLKWLHDHWGYFSLSELTTDECVCPVRNPGGNWNDGGYWMNIHKHNDSELAQYYERIWSSTIEGFNTCNMVLDNIKHSSASQALKDRATKEIEVVRSYYAYVLLDCFGAFPFNDGEYVVNNYGSLESSSAIWSAIVECLERNAPTLPIVTEANRSQYIGRVTQGFAYALLARLYLNAESFGCTADNVSVPNVDIISTQDFYTNAVRCCDNIIASNSYSIEDSYFTNFKIHNESSKENIFVLVEDGTENNITYFGAYLLHSKSRLHLLTLPYSMQQAWNLIEKPWNGFCATKSFIDRFEYGKDVRGLCDTIKGTEACDGYGWFAGPVKKDGKVLPSIEWESAAAVLTTTVSSFTDASFNDGARMIKYEVDKTGTYHYMESDFVLFRYADVLYTKAEAILRGAQGSLLSDLLKDASFKKIRQRAGVTPYSTLKLNELLDERGREFYWECVRRRDLIRFNKFNDPTYIDFLENDAPTDGYAPLPTTAVTSGFEQATTDGVYLANLGQPNEVDLMLFANGINEVTQEHHQGLYEKFAYLEAGKRYALIQKTGNKCIAYSTTLESKTINTDNNSINGYFGISRENNVSMVVKQSGLYHIIVYSNNSSLDGALIYLTPVECGVRGDMNGWGRTKMNIQKQTPSSITYILENVLIQNDYSTFMFTENNCWKINLNESETVKACASLGVNMQPCGQSIPIEYGYWTIELTWQLAGGDISNSFSYTLTKTGIPVYDPSTFVVGISGSMNDWHDPSGTTLAVYNAQKSKITDTQTNAGIYVYNISGLTFPNNSEFKFRLDGEWLSLFEVAATGVTLSEINSNLTGVEGTYDIEITMVWDGRQMTSFIAAFTSR